MNYLKQRLCGAGAVSEYSHLVTSLSASSHLSTLSSSSSPASPSSSSSPPSWFSGRRLPYLVEPVFLLFELADWSSMALTTQYVYQHMTSNASHVDPGNHTLLLDPHTSAADVRPSRWTTQAAAQSDSQASYFVLYMNLMSSVPALITTLLVCAYGDVAGRKPGLLLPNLAGAAKALVYLTVDHYKLPLWSLALAHLFEGVGGTHFTFSGSAHAYVADVTPQTRLTLRYTILQTLLLTASSVGNLSMGYFIAEVGFARCFSILLLLFTTAAVYVGFFLPESLPLEERCSLGVTDLVRGTAQAFCVYIRPRGLGRLQLLLLLAVKLMNTIIFMGLVDVETLYLLAAPFYFSPVKIGSFLAECTLLNAFGPLLVVPLLQALLRFSDTYVCLLSAASGALSFILLGLSSTPAMIFTAPALGSLMAGISPVTRSMMSKRVEHDEQGALQASLSSLSVLSGIGGVSMYLSVYGATVDVFGGLVFLLVAALFVIIACLLMVVECTTPPPSEEEEDDEEELSPRDKIRSSHQAKP